jgi:hypothetical protein
LAECTTTESFPSLRLDKCTTTESFPSFGLDECTTLYLPIYRGNLREYDKISNDFAVQIEKVLHLSKNDSLYSSEIANIQGQNSGEFRQRAAGESIVILDLCGVIRPPLANIL